MSRVARALAQELTRRGLADYTSAGATSTFVGFLPDDMDTADGVIALFDLGGTVDLAVPEASVTVQVRVRAGADDEQGAADRCAVIAAAILDTPRSTWAAGTPDVLHVVRCRAGQPYPLGTDPHGRPEWATRVEVRYVRP